MDKPANIKKFINEKFKKEISYAQVAYEMNKRKQKIIGKTNEDTKRLKELMQMQADAQFKIHTTLNEEGL